MSQGATSLSIIENSTVSYPSITSKEYVPAENGVVVSTRVPTNLFNYGAEEPISITGTTDVKLLGGDERRLRAIATHDDEIESSFELKVALQKEMVRGIEDSSTNSASPIASRGLAAFVVAFAFTSASWLD